MSRLVLTGATGFLGRAVVAELASHGLLAGTRVLCRRPALELARQGVEVRVGSLLDVSWLSKQLEPGCRVLHMAGRVALDAADAPALHQLHVEATRALCDAVLRVGCARMVVLSSSGAAAVSRTPRLHTEDAAYPMALVARWPYYLSKLLQERLVLDLCRREALPAVVLNPSLLLGPGDDAGSSTGVVRDFVARRIPFVPAGGISIVDVRDVARMTLVALERGRPGERYFLASLNCRFSTFFGLLQACSGVPAPALPATRRASVLGARALARLAGRAAPERVAAISPSKVDMAGHFWYVSSDRARRELGFAPRSAEETIRDTVRHLRATPTLGA